MYTPDPGRKFIRGLQRMPVGGIGTGGGLDRIDDDRGVPVRREIASDGEGYAARSGACRSAALKTKGIAAQPRGHHHES